MKHREAQPCAVQGQEIRVQILMRPLVRGLGVVMEDTWTPATQHSQPPLHTWT